MASLIPNSFIRDCIIGAIDVDTDSFKAMLLSSAYTPSKSHSKRSDLTGEISGTGYVAGGQSVVLTVALSNVNNTVLITVPQLIWTASTLTARHLAVYKARGGAATADELGPIIDFGTDIITSNQPFTALASTLTYQN